MKKQLHSLAAAAALLVPMGVALVAQPAAAQNVIVAPPAHQARVASVAVVAPAPTIDRFVVRPAGRLLPGRVLHFKLLGARGGTARVDIPGVVRGIALRELRPGVYEGSYTVRRRDDLQAFDRAVATLGRGKFQATARADFRDDGRRWGRDDRAPRISDLAPRNGEQISRRGRAHIAVRIDDDRSGVDLDTVRLRVDGRDVTPHARITQDEVRYADNLPRGRHRAELVVRDRAGNAARTAWSFDVV